MTQQALNQGQFQAAFNAVRGVGMAQQMNAAFAANTTFSDGASSGKFRIYGDGGDVTDSNETVWVGEPISLSASTAVAGLPAEI